MSAAEEFAIEIVPIAELRNHPRNYQEHPDDQVAHIQGSLRKHGYYKNVVIAQDGTILAGHGVVKSAAAAGKTTVPVHRMNIAPDSQEAIEILVGDNEISRLAERDDRLMSELLKEIRDSDPEADLLGTGFDDAMFANLVMVTRPASEIQSLDEAAQWIGLPEYESAGTDTLRLIVHFENEEDRQRFATLVGITLEEKTKTTWWPPRESNDDVSSLRFEDGYDDENESQSLDTIFSQMDEVPAIDPFAESEQK